VQFEGGTAQIKAYLPIAVATHPLSHGESLTEENTRFEERELSRFSQSGYFHTREQLSTRKVKGYLAAGQVISRFNCQLPPQVTPGQTVDLIRRKSDLVLVAKVKALQSGMQNQWVQVQNPSSGKILLARITGPGEVEIQ
jgi:flagella basal body P-ring formation protein FlgA